MQILLNQKIKNRKGKPEKIREPELNEEGIQNVDENGILKWIYTRWFDVREALEDVCSNPIPKVNAMTGRNEEIPAEHKKKLFRIFHRIQDSNSSLDLGTDEVELLKIYLNRRFNSPVTIGQIFHIIDPHSADWNLEKEEKKKGSKNIPSRNN